MGWKVGDPIAVPEYRSSGDRGSWRLTGERKGWVVYVSQRYIVVDWGQYEESVWIDDLAYRGSRNGLY